MNKVNLKADVVEEIGPKFVIEPFKITKFQLQQNGKTVSFENHHKKNPRVSFYAEKFKKSKNRPSTSIPQSTRQVPNTLGVRNEQPKNMGVMGSFFVNTKPNTRRVSNSLANYHAQLMKRANSQSNSGYKINLRHNKTSFKQSSQKSIGKKSPAELLYQNALNDMNDYFSLVKLSTYKRNEKKTKTDNNLKPGTTSNVNFHSQPKNTPTNTTPNNNNANIKNNLTICTNFVICAGNNSAFSANSDKRYISTQVRSRQISKQTQDNNNLSIRALRPNPVRYSQNPREFQSSKRKQLRQKPQLMIKLVTQQMLPTKDLNRSSINQYQSSFTHDKQSPNKKIQKVSTNSPKKYQKNTKKKNTYIMEYFGKIKDNTSFQQINKLKALYYRDIIWKVWFNSNWKIKIDSYTVNQTVDAPRYFVGRGNNSKLVKAIMGRRSWWKLQTKEENANFLWTQLKIYSAYQSQLQYQRVQEFQGEQKSYQDKQKRTQQINQAKKQQQQKEQNLELNLKDSTSLQLKLAQMQQSPCSADKQLQNDFIIEQQQNKKQFPNNNSNIFEQKTKQQQSQQKQKQKQKSSTKIQQNQFQKQVMNSKLKLEQMLKNNRQKQWYDYKLALNDKSSFIMTQKKYQKWQGYIKNIYNYKKQAKNGQNLQSRRNLQKGIKIIDKYPQKVTNHLQFSRLIGNKKALYKTMSIYYQLSKLKQKFLPMTYHITSGLQDQQYLKFLNQYYRRSKQQNNSMWIVKPGQMSNRGSNIKVCKDIQEIRKILKNKKCHNNGKPFTYIIQQYIRQPFLYQNRKFDIRHYIMINSTYGRIKGYFYEQGYIRTTSYKYSNTSQDPHVHLTNDAVQKYCKQYGKYQKGNKVSYEDFQKYLKSIPEYKQKQYSFYDKILPQIRQISIDIINASYYIIDPKRKGNNFQIFGLDIMIDSQFKPWLIQVNTNPCLELSSPVLAKVIPKMLDNAFTISLDPLFPPPNDLIIGNKKNSLPENYMIDNKFQLVFDEIVQGRKLNRLYEEIKDQLSQMQGYGSDQQAYESAQDDCNAQY